MPDEPTPRRRAADRVPADVLLAITEQAAENRHTLRGEMAEALTRLGLQIAEVGKKIEVGNLADLNERGRMTLALEALNGATKGLREDVADLRTDVDVLQGDVANLKEKSVAADAVASLKRWVIAAVAIPIVGIAFSGLLFLAAHH